MSDDLDRLESNDPLNHALVAWQLFFADVHSKRAEQYEQDLALGDRELRRALDDGFHGFLDAKIKDDGRIVFRRRVFGAKPQQGKWYVLPVTRDVVTQIFERIKPEEQKPAEREVVVDAERPAAPAPFDPAAALRQRAREARALLANIKRTNDELTSHALTVDARADLARIESDLSATSATLDREALCLERGETS